jgi:hypothetical protein
LLVDEVGDSGAGEDNLRFRLLWIMVFDPWVSAL